MSNWHVFYDYASVIAEVPERSASELSAQVGDYTVGDPESVYDLIKELHGLLGGCFDQWCNTLGVCHLLSTRFELKHDKFIGNKEVKVNLWK